MGCDDCVVSQQILKKLIPYARHPGGDPRGGDVGGGYDVRNPWPFRMCDTMIENSRGNSHDYREAWE